MASIINASNTGFGGLIETGDSSGQLQLQTASTAALTIDTSQNVGIGTTSPNLSGASKALSISSATDTSVEMISNGSIAGLMYSNSNGLTIGGYGAIGTRFFTASTYAGSTERMRINSSGKVLIGTTTTPGVGEGNLSVESAITIGYQPTPSVYYGRISNYNGNTGITANGDSASMFFGTTSVGGTTATERMRIDSSGYLSGTVNSLSSGIYQAYQYYRLNSTVAGSNATGAQNILGVGVTLVGSTVYEFEAVIALSKSAGTTSHTISLGFGGTATLNNISYSLLKSPSTSSLADVNSSAGVMFIQSASATAITTAITVAGFYIPVYVKGTVSVNAGGTFIPQYTLSAAPGGAYTTAAGSYMKISPLGASGANTSIGSWA